MQTISNLYSKYSVIDSRTQTQLHAWAFSERPMAPPTQTLKKRRNFELNLG